MAADWPLFATALSNAEMALAKGDRGIAARYADLVEDAEVHDRVWTLIREEWEAAERELIRRPEREAAEGEATDEDARLERARFQAVGGIASGMPNPG